MEGWRGKEMGAGRSGLREEGLLSLPPPSPTLIGLLDGVQAGLALLHLLRWE